MGAGAEAPAAPAWGTPPWAPDAGLPRQPPPPRVDVAVVGAGLTGLSAAYHLARRGVRVAVLDAGAVGAGASGSTGGLVLEGTAGGDLEGVGSCIAALEAVVGEAAIACGLRLGGCWELVHRRGPSPCAALWPDGDTMLCISGTEPGGTVDAGALLRGLAVGAHRAGATLHEGVRVERVEPGRPAALGTAGGAVRADHVVLAIGAYAPGLVPIPLGMTPALTFALATAPLSDATLSAMGLATRTPFYTVDLPYLWGRVLPGGGVVFGAGLAHPPGGDVRALAADDPAVRDAFVRLEARVRGLHPALARVAVAARWAGPIAFRRRAVPILARLPGAESVVLCAAYAGHGVALGVRVGQIVADALAAGAPLPAWGAIDPPPAR
jgi:gamma-glutamylputrescine oxidase